MPQFWMIRSGDRGYMTQQFVAEQIAAIGWPEIGDLSQFIDKGAIQARLTSAYPELSLGNLRSSTGQLWRFKSEVTVGDYVLTYEADTRTYHFGQIKSEYRFVPATQVDFPQQRQVCWLHAFSRDLLSIPSKNTLGSTLTLFRLPEQLLVEIKTIVDRVGATTNSQVGARTLEEESLAPNLEASDLEERALSRIEDLVIKLDWAEVQEVVASLLRALGYKTTVSAAGPDRGKDIFASPDGLGFEEPRIFVEVKHRRGQMGAPEIRSFVGGRRGGDKCLYVSTGGFSREAHYEAERSAIPINLVNLRDLVLLVVSNYDRCDEVIKESIPLRRIYWPVA